MNLLSRICSIKLHIVMARKKGLTMTKTISNKVKTTYLHTLRKQGEEAVYRRAIGSCFVRLEDTNHPEIDLLDLSEAFLILYRRSGDIDYFTLSKAIRRAAHTVYRELLRMGHNDEINARFLNMVR